ncbi:hypothetical protein [Stieleria varia]|uniref:Uncharacterized protein n=1 Tax=Stieleria varia TaxID=2528005 RepID=A0A5C6A3M1_9BACT|nr:hypothetical protein [Stieleria varia]TWT94502.1 hypothetical protein Pla52n_53230 [Stieleria varia]
MKKITVENYTQDKYYDKVVRAMAVVLDKQGYVSPIDVMVQMQKLTPKQVEDWRFARIAYLERVTAGGLGAVNRILRLMGFHAHDLNLIPSQTAYRKWGKGKKITLRFSKSGEPKLEAAWSRHYVCPKRTRQLKQKSSTDNVSDEASVATSQ